MCVAQAGLKREQAKSLVRSLTKGNLNASGAGAAGAPSAGRAGAASVAMDLADEVH